MSRAPDEVDVRRAINSVRSDLNLRTEGDELFVDELENDRSWALDSSVRELVRRAKGPQC